MKQLKFDHNYAQDIISGKRNKTIRLDDKNISVGDMIQLVDKVSSNKPQEWLITGDLKIIGIQEFLLKSMPVEALEYSEIDSGNQEELYQFLRRFYGESIGSDTKVKVATFTYTPYQQNVPYMVSNNLYKNENILKATLYADGGSRGNPGPSAAGFVIQDDDGRVVKTWNKYLGITTNNQAEYHALIAGLEWSVSLGVKNIQVRMDSLLVINQMLGQYKIKNRDLWSLYEKAKKLQASFDKINFSHVPRELNRLADAEVNRALDAIKDNNVVQ